MQNPQVLLNPAGNNLDEIWQFLNALRNDVALLHNNIRQVNSNLKNVANGARAYAADLNQRIDQLDANHSQWMNQLDANHNQQMDHLENMITEIRDLVLEVQQS
jgi:methyl-accepting chemotaxis protein